MKPYEIRVIVAVANAEQASTVLDVIGDKLDEIVGDDCYGAVLYDGVTEDTEYVFPDEGDEV